MDKPHKFLVNEKLICSESKIECLIFRSDRAKFGLVNHHHHHYTYNIYIITINKIKINQTFKKTNTKIRIIIKKSIYLLKN